MKQISKIAVIGNGGGGKTTLSRELAKKYNLPLTHVDSIQFLSGMVVRPIEETTKILNDLSAGNLWLIDGFGPIEVMEKRFQLADKIVFVDFPLWRHYWWCTKRQVKAFWKKRSELPEGCSEAGLIYTLKLYKKLWWVHTVRRPKFLEIFAQPEIKPKVRTIKSPSDWNFVFRNGFE